MCLANVPIDELRRFLDEGAAGLIDRSSRPHRCPQRTSSRCRACCRRSAHRSPTRPAVDLRGAGRTGPHGERNPASPRHALLARLRPADRNGDTRLENHCGALRAGTPRRAGSHGRQEDWPDPARGRLEGPRPPDRVRPRPTRTPRSGTTTFTPSSMTTHDRPTPKSLTDEKGATCAAFTQRAADYLHAHGIENIECIMTDNAWAYRYSLRDVARCTGRPASSIQAPLLPWQNGKSSATTEPCKPNGHTRQVFTTNYERYAPRTLARALQHRRRHSAIGGNPRSADCHQPDCRVHLDGLRLSDLRNRSPVAAHSPSVRLDRRA